MTKEELNEILKKHQHWLKEDCDRWENMRADLSEANLSGTNLYKADLSWVNIYKVDLSGADLSGAKLSEAILYKVDLSGANLYKVDLSGADLSGAKLSGANLSGANLYKANLSWANLSEANLYGANLYKANLSEANLSGTNLYKADLSWVNIYKADLTEANNIPFIPYACPDVGSFIGWKKSGNKIICLEIPEDAKRSSALGRKCRCDKAKVLNITELGGDPCDLNAVPSDRDKNFIYKVGEVVSVMDFDENRWHECSTGIHFFINRQEAVQYLD